MAQQIIQPPVSSRNPSFTLKIGQEHPDLPRDAGEDAYYRRGPYLARLDSGLIQLRVPSPCYDQKAVQTWKYYLMSWDTGAREWIRPAQLPLPLLEVAITHYEQLFPDLVDPRPITLPAACVGRVDFIVGNREKIVVGEWRHDWQAGDPWAVRAEHLQEKFDLDAALAWCRAHGAEIVPSHDGDYQRAFFDGIRAIRSAGAIMARRNRAPFAQADFAYQ